MTAGGPEDTAIAAPGPQRAGWRAPVGLFLLAAAVYVLTSPGRIDSIDGQIRFDVTRSLLREGKPVLRDPTVTGWGGVAGRDGRLYSAYGAAASVAALPLVWLGGLGDDPLGETRRFLFALTGPLLGALVAPLLFWFFLELGVGRRPALRWTLVSAFATLLWPASTTVLDQNQHALFLLLSLFLAHRAARRGSAALAALGGLAAGVLINYQEPFLLVVPALALAAGASAEAGDRRLGRRRFLLFLAAAGVGIALWMSYNAVRFGSPLNSGKFTPSGNAHPTALGNPLVGAAGLLLSPGKSVFLYSPPIVLGLLGFAALRRRAPALARAIAWTTAIEGLVVASLSFFHGDWCWGPRYLVPLLPLWALAFPFACERPAGRRWARPLIVAGVVCQLLGVSVVHERFFFERGLQTFFWHDHAGFYFQHSALLSRPVELWTSLRHGIPPAAREFAPTWDPRLVTSYMHGPPPNAAPDWLNGFKVFHLGRPWPCWIGSLDAATQPGPLRSPGVLLGALLGAAGAGGWLLRREWSAAQINAAAEA